jgi:hypothetical protein
MNLTNEEIYPYTQWRNRFIDNFEDLHDFIKQDFYEYIEGMAEELVYMNRYENTDILNYIERWSLIQSFSCMSRKTYCDFIRNIIKETQEQILKIRIKKEEKKSKAEF